MVTVNTPPYTTKQFGRARAPHGTARKHEEVLVALRRVMRAVDIHSRRLERELGLSGPQLVLMHALGTLGEVPMGRLAQEVHVSQATATSLVDRLQSKGLAARARSSEDGRRVLVKLTPAGRRLLRKAPPPLQEHFVRRFQEMADWEQNQILSSLQRLAQMMDAEDIEAAPMLATTALAEPDAGPR